MVSVQAYSWWGCGSWFTVVHYSFIALFIKHFCRKDIVLSKMHFKLYQNTQMLHAVFLFQSNLFLLKFCLCCNLTLWSKTFTVFLHKITLHVFFCMFFFNPNALSVFSVSSMSQGLLTAFFFLCLKFLMLNICWISSNMSSWLSTNYSDIKQSYPTYVMLFYVQIVSYSFILFLECFSLVKMNIISSWFF